MEEKMEKIWRKIMKDYIKSYDAIKHLNNRGIISDDDVVPIWLNLIADIICTLKSEVEE